MSPDRALPGTALAGRVRRVMYDLRTEGPGAGREAAAIGAGVFIGCLPFYGFHLAICWAAGRLFRLNRLKMYLAANISNPLFAPVLVLSELQAGAWMRRGSFHALTLETVRATDPWMFGADVLIGSVIVGGILAAAGVAGTYATLRGSADDRAFTELVRKASDRFVGTSLTAWEFARGKLRGDPLYRAAACGGLLPSGGTLLDVGCGQGLTLALLAEARRAFREGAWPSAWPPPPLFDHLMGVEMRTRIARLARRALGADAEIVEADVRALVPDRCRAVLLFDVLHLMPAADQDAVIGALAGRLEPDGVMLVREADAAGGWRFAFVRSGNRLKALAIGAWRQPFCFRTAAEWTACFARHGLAAEVRDMGDGTPFANKLFRVTAARTESAPSDPLSQPA